MPLFGLTGATIAEIITTVRAKLGDSRTFNRVLFERALAKSGQEAVDELAPMSCCRRLDGPLRTRLRALRHRGVPRGLRTPPPLRHIAPALAWNWRWYGYAAEKTDETEEARKAYRKAIEVNEEYDQGGTDAEERLERLGAG